MMDILTEWDNDEATEPCLPGFEYKSFNECLTIESEEDLLTTDAEGNPFYAPFTEDDYLSLESRIVRLGKDLENAVDDIRWSIDNESPDGTRLYLTICNMNHQIAKFNRFVRKCHYKLVRTIYAEHISDTAILYEGKLKNHIENFKYIISNIKSSLCNYRVDRSVFDIFILGGNYRKTELLCKSHNLSFSDFNDVMAVYADEHLINNLKDSLSLVDWIYKVLAEIRLTRISRSNAELVIIFDYLQKTYYQQLLDHCPDIDKQHYPYYRRHEGFLRQSCMKADSSGLRALQTDIKQRYKENKIVKIWYDNCFDNLTTEEKEELVYQIVKINPTEDDYHILFDYIIESENVQEQLRKRVDYESKGDPMFSVWVDTENLQEYLEPWIRANINTKGKWFVVWCLMKHTYSMLREGVDMRQFADRMNLMFDCEKPCDYNSIRKFHNKHNHNKHFSKWLTNDPNYDLASSLNSKLAKKDKFMRISDIAFQ